MFKRAQDQAALPHQRKHLLHDGLSFGGGLVARWCHDASPMIGTSHHMPAVSGTVMNSCPWPHQFTKYWSRPKTSYPARRRSVWLRRIRGASLPQRGNGYVVRGELG